MSFLCCLYRKGNLRTPFRTHTYSIFLLVYPLRRSEPFLRSPQSNTPNALNSKTHPSTLCRFSSNPVPSNCFPCISSPSIHADFLRTANLFPPWLPILTCCYCDILFVKSVFYGPIGSLPCVISLLDPSYHAIISTLHSFLNRSEITAAFLVRHVTMSLSALICTIMIPFPVLSTLFPSSTSSPRTLVADQSLLQNSEEEDKYWCQRVYIACGCPCARFPFSATSMSSSAHRMNTPSRSRRCS